MSDVLDVLTGDERSFELSRRALLKSLGGGLLVAVFAPDALAIAFAQRGEQVPQVVSAWLYISPDNKIVVLTGKVEVGQNARTSVTQAAAEELRVPPDMITVTMGDTDVVPYDMGTFGSRTTPTMIPQVRRAAATAREALVDLAAEQWSVDRKTLKAKNGKVWGAGHSASYGELSKGQPIDRPITRDPRLTPVEEWKSLGKSIPKVGIRDMVTGRHEYVADLHREDMLHAKVLRAPSFGAELATLDTSKAEAMPGVKVVHDGDFVAVAAPTVRAAQKALASIRATWNETKQPSSKDLVKVLRGSESPASTSHQPAEKNLAATYTAEYIAHVPLEPRAALAEWDGKKMTVHTGTQRPFGVRPEVATALGLDPSQVRVMVPDTGSGYGGKHTGDAAVEAARMAKSLGVPVKLVWTRREEFTNAYLRPGGVIDVRSGVSNSGLLSYWEFDNYNSGQAAIGIPYAVAEPHIQFHQVESPVRQGSYRGLAAVFNNFARESHMDEIAGALGLDPLEFRLKNLKDERLIAVLVAAADTFSWKNRSKSVGHGNGLACGTEKGSYVATIAEVSVDPQTSEIKVLRQVTAYECGAILNPDHLKNQVDGAIVQGLGGALFEAIEFENGKILNPHLSQYRVPRFRDVPMMETLLIDRKDLPSVGAGETPIIGIAPAIGNAVFDAVGLRLRSLPLRLDA